MLKMFLLTTANVVVWQEISSALVWSTWIFRKTAVGTKRFTENDRLSSTVLWSPTFLFVSVSSGFCKTRGQVLCFDRTLYQCSPSGGALLPLLSSRHLSLVPRLLQFLTVPLLCNRTWIWWIRTAWLLWCGRLTGHTGVYVTVADIASNSCCFGPACLDEKS